jgi:hypothetical protein
MRPEKVTWIGYWVVFSVNIAGQV